MTRVIKVGGRIQRDPALAPAIAAAWHAVPNGVCVVHGGGDEVSTLQRALGREPTFRGGRRVTVAADIEALRMVLSGSANKRLVAALGAAGLSAVGISGEDAGLIGATATPESGMGLVGDTLSVDAGILTHLLGGGYLPVVSPIARNMARGQLASSGTQLAGSSSDEPMGALNVNGDDAAAEIAIGLGAVELLFVSDVPGVLVGGTTARELSAADALDLIATRQAAGGMAAKLEAALRALDRGVAHVRIGDLAAIADPGRGTLITFARSFA